MKALLCSILAMCWAVGLCLVAAARPVHQYTCQPVKQPPGGCGPGCQKAIGTALLQLHAGLKGGEHLMPWHGEGPLGNTLCQEHCHAVPQYCGWAGVLCCHPEHDSHPHRNGTSCRGTDVEHEVCPDNTTPGAVWKLDLTMQKLGGSLTDQVVDALKVLTSYGLHAIDFSSNNLSGTIPERLSELGPNFTTINLNFNKLTGTIPLSIKKLPNLQHVFLSFNKLNGSLDGHFCTKQNDPLEVLILRANFLSGTADFSACTELLMLDLTDNRFTGVVPVDITNTKLISLRATNNLFSGSIPDAIWKLPLLTTVDLGNNELSGSLSEFVGTTNNLVNIYLGNNSLSGTLPESIVSNSQLLQLELQNNTGLYGTFPSVGALVGLRRLDIHNTSISGSIPQEWGELPYLEYIDISGTRMSCCDNQTQADDGPTLPPFLQFSKRFMQFDLNMPSQGARVLDDLEDVSSQPNNILCRTVVRKPAPESEWNKLQLPTINNVVDSQRWQVSPLYFWFDECTCTKFQDKSGATYRYTGVDPWCDADYNKALNVTPGPCLDMSMFVCEPLSSPLKPGVRAAIAVAAFMFTLIIAGIVAYFLLSKASKVRRFVQLTQVRLKGPPRSGPMTLVVTDIEGYSDIFRRAPEVMFKALVLHNSVLRGAKYHNGGFVLEQEGDSFTIAFYDPFSAVVFCLQAQQALLAVQWPAGLEAVQNPDTSNHTEPGGSRKGSKFNMRLSPLLGFGPKLKRVNTNNSARSVGSHVDYQPSVSHSMFYSNLLQGFGSKENLAEPVLFNGLRVRMGVVTGVVPEGTAIKNSALFQLAKVVGDFGNGGQIILDEATFGAVKEDAQALGAVEASGLNHSKLSSGRSRWNRLLRCCGCIRPNTPAEEVVLLDMGAFCQSRGEEADAELPYTTSRTLDVKQPDPQSPGTPSSWWHRLWQPCRPCSPCCVNWEDSMSGDGSDASPRTSQPLPPAAQLSRPYLGSRPRSGASGSISFGASLSGPASTSGASRGATAGSVSPTGGQQQQSGELFDLPEAADVAPKQDTAVTGRMASFSLIGAASKQITELRKTFTRSQSWQAGQADARRDWESVRLYQVLPPALAARAHTWHNKLNVKDGWICWDNIYFEAPGSTSAPLTGGSIDMFDSSASCTHLSTANSQHLPAASTRSSPASPVANGLTPTTASAAAGGVGLRLQNSRALSSSEDTSLHVQQTADSDSSSTMTAAGGQSQQGGVGSSGSLQGPQICNPLLQPLPSVTMVFMAVEGSDQLVRRRRPFTAVVQTLLSRVVRDSLRRLGGYLCRVQEGDMKFMVAFASPVTALEWCLLVQTAAMYLPWPQSAIMLLPGCKEMVDSTGRLVFRGPRIKMGVCEGVPRSIIPDHEGRADYHGQSVNMAARFMDKGARGGQIACTRELAEQVLAVWAAGGCSSSFANLRSALSTSVTESIAEYQPDSPDAGAAADATAAADAAGPSQQAGCAAAAVCRAGSGLQPLDIELPHEQAAAGVGGQQPLSASYSRPVRPVSTPGPLSPSSAASAAAVAAPGEGSADAAAEPAAALAPATAAAAVASRQGSMPARQRSTGSSWPGGLSSNNHHHQQQQGRQQAQAQKYPRLAAHLWLAHSRSSQDGSGHNGAFMQRSGSSRLPGTPEGTRALPGQQSGALGAGLAPAPPPVAPSPFVMKDVVRVPFRVEVRRLGLYQFKGGPPQQEMVQVVPSHLLGRLQFVTADIPAPASRKGQLLQPLEGRVNQPVTVQLPVLAQEYHERLPNRVSGTTGLPHRCTSPAASGALEGTLTSALGQFGSLPVGQGHGADVFGGKMWGSRSVSLPVRGGEGVSAAPAAAAAGEGLGGVHSDPALNRSAVLTASAGAVQADGSRPQSTSTVYSNLSLAVNLNAAELGGRSGADGTAMSQSSSQSSQQQQQQQGLLDGMYAPSNKQQQLVQQQRQQQGLQEHRGVTAQKQAAGKLSSESAAAAAAESCVLDMQGMVLRHDSFGSVEGAEPDQSSLPTALGDEELGLPAAAGGDGVGRLHSKSNRQVVRSARSSSSNRRSPRG